MQCAMQNADEKGNWHFGVSYEAAGVVSLVPRRFSTQYPGYAGEVKKYQ